MSAARCGRRRCVLAAAAFTIIGSLLNAQSARLLVLNKEDATLAIIDPASGKILGTVPVGQGPHEVVASTDGKWAFASNYGTGPAPGHTISMIDLAAKKELRRIDVTPLSRPHGLAFVNGKLYFTAVTPGLDLGAERVGRAGPRDARPGPASCPYSHSWAGPRGRDCRRA